MVNSLLRYPPDCTKRPHRVTNIMKKIAQLSMLMMFTALAALADPLIDFSGGYGGTMSSGGLGTAVTGLNIVITQLLALDVPQNAGLPMAVTGPSGTGLLNFTTGNVTSVTSNGSGGYTYTYGGGGTFTINGRSEEHTSGLQ